MVDAFQNRERSSTEAIYDVKGQPLAITQALAANIAFPPASVLQAIQNGWRQGQFSPHYREADAILAHVPLRSQTEVIPARSRFSGRGKCRLARSVVVAPRKSGGPGDLDSDHHRAGRPLDPEGGPSAAWPSGWRICAPAKLRLIASCPKTAFSSLWRRRSRNSQPLCKPLRAHADEEAHLRDTAQALWTPERLRIFVQNKLNGARLFAVSNREPYIHNNRNGSIEWTVPASGLVTALEPVLQACDGTWIAQATGDADRAASDDRGRVRVPPDHPQYTLRRVWLSKEEEDGFYFGFANEGLWPLCHIAHTRPIFRAEDWSAYQIVNQKFADALLEEIAGEPNPVILVQDYHFALLPQMIKKQRPDGSSHRDFLAHPLA